MTKDAAVMILALVLAAALAAPPDAADPPQSPQDKMDALQQVYDQSCGSRGYGEYDDVCNSIREQIREADKELTRAAAHPPKAVVKPAKTPPPSPASSSPPDTPPTNAPPGGYSAAPTVPKV
jgi:hypothetical protein